jgi:hypothetical protein
VLLDVDAAVAWRDAIGVMDTIRGIRGADHPVAIALVTRSARAPRRRRRRRARPRQPRRAGAAG